jgi:hypothetical protein
VIYKHGLDDAVDVATLATYEAEMVPRMHDRYAELSNGTLTQPPAVPAAATVAPKS